MARSLSACSLLLLLCAAGACCGASAEARRLLAAEPAGDVGASGLLDAPAKALEKATKAVKSFGNVIDAHVQGTVKTIKKSASAFDKQIQRSADADAKVIHETAKQAGRVVSKTEQAVAEGAGNAATKFADIITRPFDKSPSKLPAKPDDDAKEAAKKALEVGTKRVGEAIVKAKEEKGRVAEKAHRSVERAHAQAGHMTARAKAKAARAMGRA